MYILLTAEQKKKQKEMRCKITLLYTSLSFTYIDSIRLIHSYSDSIEHMCSKIDISKHVAPMIKLVSSWWASWHITHQQLDFFQ